MGKVRGPEVGARMDRCWSDNFRPGMSGCCIVKQLFSELRFSMVVCFYIEQYGLESVNYVHEFQPQM